MSYIPSNKITTGNNKTKKRYSGGIDEPVGNPQSSSPESYQPNQPNQPTMAPESYQPNQPTIGGPENYQPPSSEISSPEIQPEELQEGPVESYVPPPNTEELEEAATVGTGAAIAAESSPIDQSNELEDFRQKMADPENQKDYLFLNPNISTEPNKNKSYVRVGLLHFTDSAAINVLRDTITSIGNLFGNNGVENIIYDKLRNTVLTKVGIILGENRRCYNTTVQIERIDDNIFAHVYGTLYEKKE